MLPLSFARTTITVVRPGELNDHGRVVPDYTNTSDHDEPGCVVQPAGFSEDPTERDLTTSDRLILAPPTADVRRFDLVTLPGETGTFRVKGEPALWRSPTGAASHLAITAERSSEGLP